MNRDESAFRVTIDDVFWKSQPLIVFWNYSICELMSVADISAAPDPSNGLIFAGSVAAKKPLGYEDDLTWFATTF